MIPYLVGAGLYYGIGLTVRHFMFPREPAYVAAVWPVVLVLGAK